jgi:proteic killer suppression protein
MREQRPDIFAYKGLDRSNSAYSLVSPPKPRPSQFCLLVSPIWRLTFNALRYIIIDVIRSFKCKETEKVFSRQVSRKLPRDIQQVALRKLRMLNRAMTLQDLRVPPANRLEKLRGDRAGQYSIRINDQWRICFEWREGDAYNVEITDYH